MPCKEELDHRSIYCAESVYKSFCPPDPPQYDKTEQFLGNQKWVEEMTGEGRQEQACEYADKMDTTGGSYTRVNKVFPHIEQQ